jgi:hypothetical protein
MPGASKRCEAGNCSGDIWGNEFIEDPLGVGEVPDRDKKVCQTLLKATLEVIMLSRTLIFHREAKSAQTNGQILDASGYQCEIATTLAEARTLLGSQRYQLLLLERDDASANTQPDNYRGVTGGSSR